MSKSLLINGDHFMDVITHASSEDNNHQFSGKLHIGIDKIDTFVIQSDSY